MLQQRAYSSEEIEKIVLFAHSCDNLQAAIEANEHYQYFGKQVKVVSGRKVPHGTIGIVFYLCRKHYGKSQWSGFTTRVGIKDDEGNVWWTSTKNIVSCTDEA